MPDRQETLVEIGKRLQAQKDTLMDRGRRRHMSWGMDFDTHSVILAQEIGELLTSPLGHSGSRLPLHGSRLRILQCDDAVNLFAQTQRAAGKNHLDVVASQITGRCGVPEFERDRRIARLQAET